jgi:hypothetical protein
MPAFCGILIQYIFCHGFFVFFPTFLHWSLLNAWLFQVKQNCCHTYFYLVESIMIIILDCYKHYQYHATLFLSVRMLVAFLFGCTLVGANTTFSENGSLKHLKHKCL